MGEQRIKIKWAMTGMATYEGSVGETPVYVIEGEGDAGHRRWRALRLTVDGGRHPARTGGALVSLFAAKAQAENDLVDAGGRDYVARLAGRHPAVSEVVDAIEREIDERIARIRTLFHQMRDERDAWRERAMAHKVAVKVSATLPGGTLMTYRVDMVENVESVIDAGWPGMPVLHMQLVEPRHDS